MKLKFTVFILVFVFVMSSCVSKKDIVYFQNESIDQAKVSNDFVTTFKPDDLLQITISAKDMQSVKPFNLPIVNFMPAGGGAMGQGQLQLYLIDAGGYIDFPVLGKLKLGGKTREEVIQLLKDKLDPDYVKSPTINIFIANFSVTVTGDVRRPGTFTIPNERITLLEALALAGDLNISAERSNIKVIREEEGQKIEYQVDIRSKQLFTSPVYYLQQNDFIYVEPNKATIQAAASNPNFSLYFSVIGLFITIVTLLTR